MVERQSLRISELELIETPVDALACHELGVGAVLGEPAALEHEDLVGVTNGGETVCDDERGASLEKAIHRFLYQRLTLAVERTGRFVEDEYLGIAQDGARKGEALALPLSLIHISEPTRL